MSESAAAKTRLSSWKEVAAYFNATPRTVMRWERERGLPIRRLPGEARSRVYANVAELEAWRDSNNTAFVVAEPESAGATVATAQPTAEPTDRRFRPVPRLAALALLVVAGLAAVFILRPHPPALSAAAQDLYNTANQNFDRRTPASLSAAIDGFARVIALAPNSAEGYAGLASVYAIMPEYTAMSLSAGYAEAERNARKALSLDPRNVRALVVLAFARFYGAHDAAEADRLFARAVAIEPDNVQARHWRATYLLAIADYDAALAEIDRALALDPASVAIAADRAAIIGYAGRTQESYALLNALIAKSPEFRSPHAYLADIAFRTGDSETFVRETATRARLQNDLYGQELAESAADGLTKNGRRGMIEAMLATRVRQYDSGVGSAFEIAKLQLALGSTEEARRYLELSQSRREPETAYIAMEPGLLNLLPAS